jgi:hypothetical protein
MGATVLACGQAEGATGSLADRPDVIVHAVPALPGQGDVDGLLAAVGPDDRVVVVGTDADLAAVVLRLMTTERLGVPVGYVPLSADSPAAGVWGLPVAGEEALDVALEGRVWSVPLVRDAKGGVLVGLGTIGPLRGVAYCDDTRLLRGPARLIRVTPHTDGVEVDVTPARLFGRKPEPTRGRAFELGCLPTVVTRDGVPLDRPVMRWHWYRHTEDLRLVRG